MKVGWNGALPLCGEEPRKPARPPDGAFRGGFGFGMAYSQELIQDHELGQMISHLDNDNL